MRHSHMRKRFDWRFNFTGVRVTGYALYVSFSKEQDIIKEQVYFHHNIITVNYISGEIT